MRIHYKGRAMDNLFRREEQVLQRMTKYLKSIPDDATCSREEFSYIVKEYERLLRQSKRITKISDLTADNLYLVKIGLMEKAHHDALTGIYNRRFMEENLYNIITNLKKSGGMISVLMLDVDSFKNYNDTYGHQKGDKCLQLIAGALQKGIRCEKDFVARYGGEEFAVILPETDQKTACTIAGRLLDNVRKCKIVHAENDTGAFVTISAGVTTGIVTPEMTGEFFLRLADKALYRSKQTGKDKYTFIKPEEN